MDLQFTASQEAFRQEIRKFAKSELPAGWLAGLEYGDEYCEEYWPITRQICKKLAAKGWLGIACPKEYGGQPRSHLEQLIYFEETAYHGVPGFDMGIGGVGIGLILTFYGSEDQRREHLPGVVAGERFWCFAYSEPGAGSDLGSLQCRAIVQGNDYVINGQKIWTSAAQIADWCFLLATTDPNAPRYRGASMLLVDMKSQGITVHPLINMAGLPTFNEVFFDGVRVPKRNLVGEPNQAWHYMPMLLSLERLSLGIRATALAKRILDDIVLYVKKTQYRGLPPAAVPILRHKLAEVAIEIEVGRVLAYRAAWLADKGLNLDSEAAMSKVFGSELKQRVANLAMNILGLYGQLRSGCPRAPLEGKIERLYLSSVGETLLGGTSEIQRNTIALRGLGLPR